VVSNCMTALPSGRQQMASAGRAISVVTCSVECLVRVEAFDVEMDKSSMELIKYFTTCRRGKK